MMKWLAGAAMLAAGCGPAAAQGLVAQRGDAGVLRDGSRVEAIELSNGRGITARILTYGATLQSLVVPDRRGQLDDIVLGHDTAAEYEATQDFLGVTVGRYANRIDGGKFVLDGRTFQLRQNDGANSLHGGGQGFDRANWRVRSVQSGPRASVVLEHVSPDGHSGYPGEVTTTVTYSMDEAGALTIAFAATTTKPTIMNMTNHALFNLGGDCSPGGALNARLTMPAGRYNPVSEALIPNGEPGSPDVLAKMMSWVAWCSPELNRFLPLITHSSPSATAVVSRKVASDPWFGSVSPKARRRVPSRKPGIQSAY